MHNYPLAPLHSPTYNCHLSSVTLLRLAVCISNVSPRALVMFEAEH